MKNGNRKHPTAAEVGKLIAATKGSRYEARGLVSMVWEHTLFVLPSVGRISQTSFRQVFSRNPVFLNQTTGARSWIPAQKRRRNDETSDHPFLSTNGVCSLQKVRDLHV
jgi:hypothetical protein